MITGGEFRSPATAQALLTQIRRLAEHRHTRFMEVCGGHTMSIWRYGLPHLLGDSVELLSGPGCPVCVTPNSYLDRVVALARRPENIIVTFGDLLRVPGSSSDLQTERARGGDVRIVYSSRDALDIARAHPEKTIIFLAIGFETTAPTIAATVQSARRERVSNFRILSALKTMPQALRIVAADEHHLDGLLLPGHVSAITGLKAFDFLAGEYRIRGVVSGFEPSDILQSILMLIRQMREGRCAIEIQYSRCVRENGNLRAQKLLEQVFDAGDAEWRGLGLISGSGLYLKEEYREFDAGNLGVEVEPTREHPGCCCGDVIRGALKPEECGLFGGACRPEHPIGACMVSEEGACAAHYKYRGLS
jgi:hydrogenase expression/formation protein HypD